LILAPQRIPNSPSPYELTPSPRTHTHTHTHTHYHSNSIPHIPPPSGSSVLTAIIMNGTQKAYRIIYYIYPPTPPARRPGFSVPRRGELPRVRRHSYIILSGIVVVTREAEISYSNAVYARAMRLFLPTTIFHARKPHPARVQFATNPGDIIWIIIIEEHALFVIYTLLPLLLFP